MENNESAEVPTLCNSTEKKEDVRNCKIDVNEEQTTDVSRNWHHVQYNSKHSENIYSENYSRYSMEVNHPKRK